MTSGSLSSIKTIDVASPPSATNYSTLGGSGSESVVLDTAYGSTCGLAPEPTPNESLVYRFLVRILKVYVRSADYLRRLPNAVRDVEPRQEHVFSYVDPFYFCMGGTAPTAPLCSTLSVVEKKYSEVFQEVFSLRHPEDPDDPVPTELAYWHALKAVASAYDILKIEHPRSSALPKPTAVVDNSGGVRLIWSTASKRLKANFAARTDMKSYIYYESGPVYDTEPMEPHTLARRLGWLI